MTTDLEALESGLELYRSLIAEDASLRAEFQASEAEFFRGPRAGASEAERALGDRRHLEWFLLERLSPALRRAPIELLEERWQERAGAAERALAPAYKGSLASVFEVTGVAPGEGLWLADLAGQGEYPVREPKASTVMEKGDLVVGRVFPVDASLYRLSRAAAVFRDPKLLSALRRDVERAREGRRGVLRIAQDELEAMFWTPRQAQTSDPLGDARHLLADAGLESEEVEELLERLRRAPFDPSRLVYGSGDALGPILDRLAFETPVDLDRARETLILAWSSLHAAPEETAPAEHVNGKPRSRGASAPDVRAAMDAFEQGRAAGKDLDTLFDELEHELELDELPESAEIEDELLAPDFPGVVGAMVEEFLWESERESGPKARAELEPLRDFARFASKIGVFENLGARDLLLYTTYWLPEFGKLQGSDDALASLIALRSFCRWAEEQQDVALWSSFGRTLAALRESLPRIAEANQRRPRSDPSAGEVFTLLGVADERLRVRDLAGNEEERAVDPMLAQWLRAGDRVRGSRVGADRLAIFCCYPPELGELEPE